MTALPIEPILCRRDNYAYLIREDERAWVVDPSEAEPVQAVLKAQGLQLEGILITHHHHDHVGGVEALCAWQQQLRGAGPWVAGHASDRGRIPRQSEFVDAPRGRFVACSLHVAGHPLYAAHIPGHTTGAIAWKVLDEIFTGDTLFSAGCGRLMEGSAEDMFESFATLLATPEHTRLWFGHEYTAANLAFAARAQPEHKAYEQAAAQLQIPSCPTTVGRERQINIFARAETAEQFGKWRALKDRG